MIISHSKKFIFVSNPKTGSTSIDSALAEFSDDPLLNEICEDGLYTDRHMPAQILKDRLSSHVWNEYFKFAFVRNPWDWFVSQHFYNLNKNGIVFDLNAKLENQQILYTFDFLKIYRGKKNALSAFQHSFLCDDGNKILFDFIGRFERLDDDFQKIQKIIKTEVALPHLNPSRHKPYRHYFNDETKAIIAKLYKIDIDLFQYVF